MEKLQQEFELINKEIEKRKTQEKIILDNYKIKPGDTILKILKENTKIIDSVESFIKANRVLEDIKVWQKLKIKDSGEWHFIFYIDWNPEKRKDWEIRRFFYNHEIKELLDKRDKLEKQIKEKSQQQQEELQKFVEVKKTTGFDIYQKWVGFSIKKDEIESEMNFLDFESAKRGAEILHHILKTYKNEFGDEKHEFYNHHLSLYVNNRWWKNLFLPNELNTEYLTYKNGIAFENKYFIKDDIWEIATFLNKIIWIEK